MKILAVILASLTLLTSPSLFAGKVYRVINADGQVTFTDSPPANASAETVDMPVTNIAITQPPPSKKTDGDEVTENEVAYTSARILQPVNSFTVPPGLREVVVQLAFKPSLQAKHLVQLYIDGHKQGSPSAASTFTLTNLDRGQHSLYAEVVGPDKKRKIKTQTVIFHVKQHSSKHNAKNTAPSPSS